MAWVWLVVAGLLEVVWAVGLKYSEGFSRLVPSVITAVAAAASFWLLAVALKHIPLGTGYVFWVGIGAVGDRGRHHRTETGLLARCAHDDRISPSPPTRQGAQQVEPGLPGPAWGGGARCLAGKPAGHAPLYSR